MKSEQQMLVEKKFLINCGYTMDEAKRLAEGIWDGADQRDKHWTAGDQVRPSGPPSSSASPDANTLFDQVRAVLSRTSDPATRQVLQDVSQFLSQYVVDNDDTDPYENEPPDSWDPTNNVY